METLEFLFVIATFAVVLFWYVQNHVRGADGGLGLLAVATPAAAEAPGHKRAYRVKKRIARRGRDLAAIADNDGAAPTYRVAEAAHMRRRFRNQDDARYRAKDLTGPRYKEKNAGDRLRTSP